MGRIVIAAFKPHPGKEAELLRVIADRLVLMRKLGMVTDRTNTTMRSADGVILDVSEWVDQEAISRAHRTPEVLELWKRFSEVCDFVKLDSLSEASQDFATFTPV